MGHSLAIPLKKRRKPPGFWFWWNLFFLLWSIAWSVWDLVHYLLDNHIVFLITFGFQAVFIYLFYKLFKREYLKWRDRE